MLSDVDPHPGDLFNRELDNCLHRSKCNPADPAHNRNNFEFFHSRFPGHACCIPFSNIRCAALGPVPEHDPTFVECAIILFCDAFVARPACLTRRPTSRSVRMRHIRDSLSNTGFGTEMRIFRQPFFIDT